jgi:hypothetical protein
MKNHELGLEHISFEFLIRHPGQADS